MDKNVFTGEISVTCGSKQLYTIHFIVTQIYDDMLFLVAESVWTLCIADYG